MQNVHMDNCKLLPSVHFQLTKSSKFMQKVPFVIEKDTTQTPNPSVILSASVLWIHKCLVIKFGPTGTFQEYLWIIFMRSELTRFCFLSRCSVFYSDHGCPICSSTLRWGVHALLQFRPHRPWNASHALSSLSRNLQNLVVIHTRSHTQELWNWNNANKGPSHLDLYKHGGKCTRSYLGQLQRRNAEGKCAKWSEAILDNLDSNQRKHSSILFRTSVEIDINKCYFQKFMVIAIYKSFTTMEGYGGGCHYLW